MEKQLVAATNSKVNNHIPDDITFSNLSKLPLKSLKRFECVAKSWSLLFENHRFMKMFRNNLVSNSHRCYYDRASLLVRVGVDCKYDVYSHSGTRFENKVKLDCSNPYVNHLDFRIFGFGSINGTLCLQEHNSCGKIVLWNPVTQTIRLIPSSTVESSIPNVDKDFGMSILHGFGYDDLINDYKLIRYVCIWDEHSDDEDISSYCLDDKPLDTFWEIYSLRSNSWRKLDVDMPSSLDDIEGSRVYMDGLCHWLCERDSPIGPCLVSFNLSNESFFLTPTPSDDQYAFRVCWINLAVLDRSIAMISNYEDSTFHISMLGEFGTVDSWTKLLVVGPLSCAQLPIGVGMKGEIFFIREDEELVWLDFSTQRIEMLGYKKIDWDSQITVYKENNLPIGERNN